MFDGIFMNLFIFPHYIVHMVFLSIRAILDKFSFPYFALEIK